MLAALAFVLAVPREGIVGKVMCGYQGWFTTPDDGNGMGWFHYGKNGRFEPGSSNVEFWPDVRELGTDERVDTPFTMGDGKPAQVYRAGDPKTIRRHFEWMRRYGIDGVYLQRFATDLRSEANRRFRDRVLDGVRAGAEANGRVFAAMYDLSGLGKGETAGVLRDWEAIRAVTKSPSYLREGGKPVVAVWGVGFNDHRRYTVEECGALVDALKADGNVVLVGVPTYWRAGDRDALPGLEGTILKADVVQPWAVGRFGDDAAVRRYAEGTLQGDLAWGAAHGKTIMPVVYPGFSWHNMNPDSPQNQIPRRRGAFLRTQFDAYRAAGAKAAYVAMFDEMDEGTAIFKVAPNPPAGFLDTEGLPSDYYLRLVGEETRTFRVER